MKYLVYKIQCTKDLVFQNFDMKLDYLIKSKVFYLSFSFEILFFSKKYETPIS